MVGLGAGRVLFDLPARRFHVFALEFWPQDFVFLALLLAWLVAAGRAPNIEEIGLKEQGVGPYLKHFAAPPGALQVVGGARGVRLRAGARRLDFAAHAGACRSMTGVVELRHRYPSTSGSSFSNMRTAPAQ